MKNKKGLEIYYSGDKNWEDLVTISHDTWDNSKYQLSLIHKLDGNEDIASVIYNKLSTDSINWVERAIPALGNLKPIECIYSEDLKLRLKECLMRMP
jgi:hypothetical protein